MTTPVPGVPAAVDLLSMLTPKPAPPSEIGWVMLSCVPLSAPMEAVLPCMIDEMKVKASLPETVAAFDSVMVLLLRMVAMVVPAGNTSAGDGPADQ